MSKGVSLFNSLIRRPVQQAPRIFTPPVVIHAPPQLPKPTPVRTEVLRPTEPQVKLLQAPKKEHAVDVNPHKPVGSHAQRLFAPQVPQQIDPTVALVGVLGLALHMRQRSLTAPLTTPSGPSGPTGPGGSGPPPDGPKGPSDGPDGPKGPRGPSHRDDVPSSSTGRKNTAVMVYKKPETAVVETFSDKQGAKFDIHDKMLTEFQRVKSTTNPEDRVRFAQEAVPAYFARLRQAGVETSPAMVNEMMLQLSYLSLPNGTKFTLDVTKGQADLYNMSKSGKVTFELVDQHTQRVDQRGISELPKDVKPGTGFHIWKVTTEDRETHAVAFRGTNSVGNSRDKMLTDKDGTGAIANGTSAEVGAGIADHFLQSPSTPLALYNHRITAVLGHSLGGSIAQQYVRGKAERGEEVPSSYFASSPPMGKPEPKAWTEASSRQFYPYSPQDVVPYSGKHSYSGMELNPGMGSIPVSQGYAGIYGDGLSLQHGSSVATLMTMKDGQADFVARKSTASKFGFAMNEGRKLTADQGFKGTDRENMLHMIDAVGLTQELAPSKSPSAARGKEVGYLTEAATTLVNGSPMIQQMYAANPEFTLRTIANHREQLRQDPRAGIETIKNALAMGIPELPSVYVPLSDAPSLARNMKIVNAQDAQL